MSAWECPFDPTNELLVADSLDDAEEKAGCLGCLVYQGACPGVRNLEGEEGA